MAEEEIVFRDFSKKKKIVKFRIDPDDFLCVSGLSIFTLQDIMNLYRSEEFTQARKDNDAEKIINVLEQIFEFFLAPESYAQFTERLRDKMNPIDVVQLLEITAWLIEIYANRPSQPSDTSSPGSLDGEGGTDFPGGAQLETSIPLSSMSLHS